MYVDETQLPSGFHLDLLYTPADVKLGWMRGKLFWRRHACKFRAKICTMAFVPKGSKRIYASWGSDDLGDSSWLVPERRRAG